MEEARVNRKAIAFLLKSVDDRYIEDIGEMPRAKDISAKLKRIHSTYTLKQCFVLKKETINIEKTDRMSMYEYTSLIQQFNRKIAAGGWGLELTDAQLAGQFLVGLPDKYEVMVNYLSREPELTTEGVKSFLMREEQNAGPRPTSAGARAYLGAAAAQRYHGRRADDEGGDDVRPKSAGASGYPETTLRSPGPERGRANSRGRGRGGGGGQSRKPPPDSQSSAN